MPLTTLLTFFLIIATDHTSDFFLMFLDNLLDNCFHWSHFFYFLLYSWNTLTIVATYDTFDFLFCHVIDNLLDRQSLPLIKLLTLYCPVHKTLWSPRAEHPHIIINAWSFTWHIWIKNACKAANYWSYPNSVISSFSFDL